MKNTDVFLAIGEIDTKILEKSEAEKKRIRTRKLFKWGSFPVAACLCIAVMLSIFPPFKANAEFTVEDGVLLSYNGNKEDVVIPREVSAVADYAFSNNPQLTTVTLTENVSSIGSCAFYGCTKLSDIIISEGNTDFIKENDTVMSSDRRLIVKYFGDEKIYTIPKSVLFLAAETFVGSGVQEVILHDKIRFIGKDCFTGVINQPQPFRTEDGKMCLTDDAGNYSLDLMLSTEIGNIFGYEYDNTSIFGSTITSYTWDEESESVFIYRFGGKGEYYQVLSFHPELVGTPDKHVAGNFWSETDGMIALDSGVTVKYGPDGKYYIVKDDPYYDGFALATEVYLTHDGGLTWTKCPGEPVLQNRKLYTVSAGFADDKVGYFCSRIYYSTNPTAWVTIDGGNSWQEMLVEIPLENFPPDGTGSQIVSIAKENGLYVLLVEVRYSTGYDSSVKYLTYTSTDGIDWKYINN